MKRFVEGEDRTQSTLFPERLDDYTAADNPVRAVETFVDTLDLKALGFESVEPHSTGRPAYHPSTLLKLNYMDELDKADRSEPAVSEAKTERLQEKLETLKGEMVRLRALDKQMHNEPDKQLSLTDPDSCSMATRAKGSGHHHLCAQAVDVIG